jgi:hypothetical protein
MSNVFDPGAIPSTRGWRKLATDLDEVLDGLAAATEFVQKRAYGK